MLHAIEKLLAAPLTTALGDKATLAFGALPTPTDPVPAKPQVFLAATRLDRHVTPFGSEDDESREPVVMTRHIELSATPETAPPLYKLPAEATDMTIGEVQSPPGHVLVQGDDYSVDQDGKAIRLFRTTAATITVTLRGQPARGYVERGPAEITLSLAVSADSADKLDEPSVLALQGVLGTLADCQLLDLITPSSGDTSLSARLLHPICRLVRLERGASHTQTATLLLRGELEITLALGAPEATGRIQAVEVGLLPVGRR